MWHFKKKFASRYNPYCISLDRYKCIWIEYYWTRCNQRSNHKCTSSFNANYWMRVETQLPSARQYHPVNLSRGIKPRWLKLAAGKCYFNIEWSKREQYFGGCSLYDHQQEELTTLTFTWMAFLCWFALHEEKYQYSETLLCCTPKIQSLILSRFLFQFRRDVQFLNQGQDYAYSLTYCTWLFFTKQLIVYITVQYSYPWLNPPWPVFGVCMGSLCSSNQCGPVASG